LHSSSDVRSRVGNSHFRKKYGKENGKRGENLKEKGRKRKIKRKNEVTRAK
jgi:hypothetical protein